MTGFVKLHRKILESSVFENPNLLKTFIWCLTRASYKNRKAMVGLNEVELEAGQFITGRKSASLELGFSESAVQKYFKTLEKMGILAIKTAKKYTILTIVKWAFYQNETEENEEKIEEKSTTKHTNETTENTEVSEVVDIKEYQQKNESGTNQERIRNKSETNQEHKQEIKNIEKLKKEKKERTHTYRANEQLDPRVESVKCVFEQRYGLLNYSVVEDITMLINSGMQEDVIIKALSLANKGYSANYALKICKNWLSDGVKTMQDYEVKEGVRYGNNQGNHEREECVASTKQPEPVYTDYIEELLQQEREAGITYEDREYDF